MPRDQYILETINPITLQSDNVTYQITNPNSKFVVITYWWGRGNINKNLSRPCPPSPQNVGQPTTTYDEMIEGPGGWIETCQAANVNYMAAEYDRFSAEKQYQKAINAKPYFIKKALELCAPRAVLYIDGDMTVNRYPAIFDIDDVDFMARNWNCDPRSHYNYEDEPAADFYTFETSGGIMYFGQTPQAHHLLDAWIEATELAEMAGKADDRILSLIFNNFRMYLPINFIQLPVEYLWLTMLYGDKPKKNDNLAYLRDIYSKAIQRSTKSKNGRRLLREIQIMEEGGYIDMRQMKIVRDGQVTYEDPWSYVFIEHPHCLTPEEVAREQSSEGASNREPATYWRNVSRRVAQRSGGWFHDYIFFDNAEQAKAFLPYTYYADTHTLFEEEYFNNNNNDYIYEEVPLLYHERYEDRYGKFNAIAAKNRQAVYDLNQINYKKPSAKKISEACRVGFSRLSAPCKILSHPTIQNGIIPEILYYLHNGLDVLYVPANANPQYVRSVISEANEGNNQFITVNVSEPKKNIKVTDMYPEYLLKIPLNAPIYFSHNSKILQHLLYMCRTLADLPKLFNKSFIFLTRIRCKWVARGAFMELAADVAGAAIPEAAIDNAAGAELADIIVNPDQPQQQVAVIEALPALIQENEMIPATRSSQTESVFVANLANKVKGMKLGGRRRRKSLRKHNLSFHKKMSFSSKKLRSTRRRKHRHTQRK